METGDDAERDAVGLEWMTAASLFWTSATADDAKPTMKKLSRGKVWRWLITTWHMLLASSGKSWASLRQVLPDDERGPPLSWPSFTLSIDQGGDGWSAAHYLMSWGVNLVLLHDPSHRVWSDTQLALQDCGLWHWCMLTALLMNVDSGPYKSQAWGEERKQGVKEYFGHRGFPRLDRPGQRAHSPGGDADVLPTA